MVMSFSVKKYGGALWLVCPTRDGYLSARDPVRLLMVGWSRFYSQPLVLEWAIDWLEGEW